MKIIYTPGEGDPATTTAYGRRWRANVPIEMSENDGYTVMESVRSQAMDGTSVLTTRERKISILELARGNPSFQVGDEPQQTVARRLEPDDVEDAANYRKYAMQWFPDETSVAGFQQRWEDEEGMRERCGVTDEDVKFLTTSIKIRLHELERAAKDERIAARMSR